MKQLKEDAEAYLGEPVTEAIISVPAYFNDHQRTATKLAAKLANLHVERIINEPSAAAIANRSGAESESFLVVDFGGGTLDISVVETFENIVEIVAIAGDNHLGGDDFDNAIAEKFYETYPEIKSELSIQEKATVLRLAEQCKIALSTLPMAIIIFEHNDKTYKMDMDNQQLIECGSALLMRFEKVLRRVLKDSGKHINNIDEIILVGGSSKMPTIKKFLWHLTGKEPKSRFSPDMAVAVGAGVVSGIKCRDAAIKDIILSDICPFSLGTTSHNRVTEKSEFSPIIERNTPLPVSNTRIYRTVSDFQKRVVFSIYQGESMDPKDNLKLGEYKIDVPPARAGEIEISVRFTYDINGILDIEIKCLQTGETRQGLIVNDDSLSQQQIDEHTRKLQVLKLHPRGQEENQLMLARGERLYAENCGETRDYIASLINYFQKALESNNLVEIEKSKRTITELFNKLEQDNSGLYEDD